MIGFDPPPPLPGCWVKYEFAAADPLKCGGRVSNVKDSRWLNAELGVGGNENMLIPDVDCARREWLLVAAAAAAAVVVVVVVAAQLAGEASKNSTAAFD